MNVHSSRRGAEITDVYYRFLKVFIAIWRTLLVLNPFPLRLSEMVQVIFFFSLSLKRMLLGPSAAPEAGF